jgi:hypothetical protein
MRRRPVEMVLITMEEREHSKREYSRDWKEVVME